MKVGVISDTHLTSKDIELKGKELLGLLHPYFNQVDLIIHAGDMIDFGIISLLENFARVEAVSGNMDHSSNIIALSSKKILELEGHQVGLTHGWGPPYEIRKRIRESFPDSVNNIIYGHTHEPFNQTEQGVYFFNPGTAFDQQFTDLNSIGLLDIGSKIEGRIVYLNTYN